MLRAVNCWRKKSVAADVSRLKYSEENERTHIRCYGFILLHADAVEERAVADGGGVEPTRRAGLADDVGLNR
jgi:hypothetical protein